MLLSFRAFIYLFCAFFPSLPFYSNVLFILFSQLLAFILNEWILCLQLFIFNFICFIFEIFLFCSLCIVLSCFCELRSVTASIHLFLVSFDLLLSSAARIYFLVRPFCICFSSLLPAGWIPSAAPIVSLPSPSRRQCQALVGQNKLDILRPYSIDSLRLLARLITWLGRPCLPAYHW